ncbi:MAG: hypothetical protein SchgKO_06840 [Schleiferiaceae bacterium]
MDGIGKGLLQGKGQNDFGKHKLEVKKMRDIQSQNEYLNVGELSEMGPTL